MKHCLILGATTSMGRALSQQLAKQGVPLVLADPDREELERISQDLEIRYGKRPQTLLFDLDQPDTHAPLFRQAVQMAGEIEGVFLVASDGTPTHNWPQAHQVLTRHFTHAAAILLEASDYLQERRAGYLVALSSVVPHNALYSASTAGLNALLAGLRARLNPVGVRVLTVKPGFVDTPMTDDSTHAYLLIPPSTVAEAIWDHLQKGAQEFYVPAFWHPWLLPWRIFLKALYGKVYEHRRCF